MAETTVLERVIARLSDSNITPVQAIVQDCLDMAYAAIMNRRFPFEDWPDQLETRYEDLQARIAIDLYNKIGAEGQLNHSENGIARTYESSWVSEQLLSEVVPKCGVPR